MSQYRAPHNLTWLLLLITLMPVTMSANQGTPIVWKVSLHDILESLGGPSRGNLEVSARWQDGRFIQGLAKAKNFNQMVHIIEASPALMVSPDGSFSGNMTIRIVSDGWYPAQSYDLPITIEGHQTHDGIVSGTYKVGDDIDSGLGQGGQQGTFEGTWNSSPDPVPLRWEIVLSPKQKRGWPRDRVGLVVETSPTKLENIWIGWAGNNRVPAQLSPLPIKGLRYNATHQMLSGSVALSERLISPNGDPGTTRTIQLKAFSIGDQVAAMIEEMGDSDWTIAGGGSVKPHDLNQPPSIWRHLDQSDPWWIPVTDFKPVTPGEHPRLLFRKSDLPALRKKAETETGRAILNRLRVLLGNDGESLPDRFNDTRPHNIGSSPKLEPGAFTSWHGVGYGLLYQLSGDSKYADLAMGAVELMRDGAMDIDNRYGWTAPGAPLRAGSLLGAMAMTYDLCYDGWTEPYRQEIASLLMGYDQLPASQAERWDPDSGEARPKGITLEGLLRTNYPPASNHYGAIIGGPGLALLAVRGEPGINQEKVEQNLLLVDEAITRMLTLGFGDAGMYAEGFPPSRLSSNGGFLELLWGMRMAAGRDYINGPRRNASWLSLRWIHHLVGHGEHAFPSRGTYGRDEFVRDHAILSKAGDFAYGFGSVPQQYRQALLWSWERYADPTERELYSLSNEPVFSALKYPHRAAFAFLSWPLEPAVNPEGILPKVVVDHVHGYVISRNRWQDEDDIVVSHHLDYGPRGYYRIHATRQIEHNAGVLRIWGHGLRTWFATSTGKAEPVAFSSQEDGSFSLTTWRDGKQTGLLVDLSGTAGAELVVIASGHEAIGRPGGRNSETNQSSKASTARYSLTWRKQPLQVLTLQTGTIPQVRVTDDQLFIGNAAFEWKEGQLVRMK